AEAILDRLLERDLTVGGVYKPGGFVGARRFSTRNGDLQREDLICGLAEIAEHMVYGPFDRLARGHNAAEFHFAVAGAPPRGPGRLELDVFANGKSCLARRWLDVAASGPHQRRTLAFFNDDEANVIEFRIRAQAFTNGALAFRGVSIR